MKSVQERFEEIYATGEWEGGGSGEGSQPVHTRGYVRFLQKFLKKNRIRSVLDFGCGDWQFSRFIDWSGLQYLGLDLVRPVVERNREAFGAPHIEFRVFEGDFSRLPAADLIIAKDVLQHWSHRSVKSFLSTLLRYRYALITNCVNPGGITPNEDIEDGSFRWLDIRLDPFHWPAREVYSFSNYRPFSRRFFQPPRWTKKVLLLQADLNRPDL
ncbi:MAG: class I SAM-dependent methyltransferase [Deltaproteobacteria bacterium]|nr:class I SAM-dependent methyltransferase [Deltaproteobacteria bacterium]